MMVMVMSSLLERNLPASESLPVAVFFFTCPRPYLQNTENIQRMERYRIYLVCDNSDFKTTIVTNNFSQCLFRLHQPPVSFGLAHIFAHHPLMCRSFCLRLFGEHFVIVIAIDFISFGFTSRCNF